MTIAPSGAETLRTIGGATRPWTTAGYATAQWRARYARRCPPPPNLLPRPHLRRLENQTVLTDPVQANIIAS